MTPKRRGARARRPPTVAYTLIQPGDEPEMHTLLRDLRERYHEELLDAAIALGWCTSWRLDTDGHQKLGQCRRATDLDRELHQWDFVILLNRDFWQHENTTPIVRAALLDHELCHATVKRDPETHEAMKNDRGKIVYRIRHHDIEEFSEIPKRHGLWRHELDAFARACAYALKHPKLPLDVPRGDDDEHAIGIH